MGEYNILFARMCSHGINIMLVKIETTRKDVRRLVDCYILLDFLEFYLFNFMESSIVSCFVDKSRVASLLLSYRLSTQFLLNFHGYEFFLYLSKKLPRKVEKVLFDKKNKVFSKKSCRRKLANSNIY